MTQGRPGRRIYAEHDRDGRRHARRHQHGRRRGRPAGPSWACRRSSTGSARSRRRSSLPSTAIYIRTNRSPCSPTSRRSWRRCHPIEKVVVVPYVNEDPDISAHSEAPSSTMTFSRTETKSSCSSRCPSSHPVYIMFSSGTTGKPKCMVQSVGGILVNQLKELVLHADLKREDTIIYMTAPSWMMWNWLMAALGAGRDDRPLRRQPRLSGYGDHVEAHRRREDHLLRHERNLHQSSEDPGIQAERPVQPGTR